MNVKRGTFRIWAAASLLWMAFWSWQANLPCLIGFNITGNQPWCSDPLVEFTKVWSEALLLIFGFPVLTGLAILILVWIIKGFKVSN